MPLNPIKPGLRAIRYDSVQVGKVELRVPPGDVLQVSDEVADQLQRADSHFKSDDADPAVKVEPAETAEPAAKRKPGRPPKIG